MTVRAVFVAPESVEVKSFSEVPLAYETTRRPQVELGAAPGGGGWTSGIAPVPTAVSGVPTGADQVEPPSEERMTKSWFAGVEAVLVYAT